MTALAAVLFFLLCANVHGRTPHDVGDWLCSKIFEGAGATLALACDGFFGLRIAPPGKSVQNITGLWRLAPDAIELSLFNLQDAKMQISVGKDGLHASLGALGQVTLLPMETEKALFRITGLLELRGGEALLTDAASGRSFPVKPDPAAEDGKFAVVELEIGKDGFHTGKMLKHSRPVPRLYEHPHSSCDPEEFNKSVCNLFWLLPSLPGVEKSALRFSSPKQNVKTADYEGSFEVVGKGLRLEGQYILTNDRLTLTASRASVRNLEIIGAGEIANLALGQFTWRISPRGLELLGGKQSLLLLAM